MSRKGRRGQRHDIGRQKLERVRKLRPQRTERARKVDDADRLATHAESLAQELGIPKTSAPAPRRRGTTNTETPWRNS
ncbi:hypothetical protein [Demequina sp. SO4-18]|uniref:hypothetical protein n=1 Tax=Demequina sp. SO4-18 TaxID=3401026 RepID=UPI003B593CAD